MSDEQVAKLILMYWEAWDKSDSVVNYQRGIDDIPHQYYEGYCEAIGEVLEMFGLNANSAIPPQIKADMDAQWERAKESYARVGLDLDALTGKTPKGEDT